MDPVSFEEGLKIGVTAARIVAEREGMDGLRDYEGRVERMVAVRRGAPLESPKRGWRSLWK